MLDRDAPEDAFETGGFEWRYSRPIAARASEASIVIAESLCAGELAIFERLSARVAYDARYATKRAMLLAVVRDADALVVRDAASVDRELIEAAPRLVAIGCLGSGSSNVDVDFARARGITIVDAGSANAAAVAEYVFAALFSVERNVPALDRAVRAGAWPRFELPARELGGKTLGIVGLGHTGSRVARAGMALGMHVIGTRRTPGLPAALEGTGVERVSKGALLSRSHYVALLLPALSDGAPYLGANDFTRMREGVVLVNPGRASLLDERALLASLNAGHVRAAVLDRRVTEPPAPGDALAAHRSAFSTPHAAALTVEARLRVSETVARGLASILEATSDARAAVSSGL